MQTATKTKDQTKASNHKPQATTSTKPHRERTTTARQMWAAIKTDLSEFLTSASAESESVLNSLDQTIDSLDEKLNHSDVIDENNAIDANDLYAYDYEESPEEEAVRLAGLVETYAEPLVVEDVEKSDLKELSYETNDTSYEIHDSENDEELFEERQIEQFLVSFDLETHSEEIAQLLHPLIPIQSDDEEEAAAAIALTPLQRQYQHLVPQTISHEDFWTRYYFRCNPALIYERNEHKTKLQEQQRLLDVGALNEAALNIGKSAASLFKNVSGAMGAVGESLGEATKELRLHQSSGRPPFVTTALDEDDDEYIEGEEESEGGEESEEASLGWGSESEEEVDIGLDNEDQSIHDEVAFGNGPTMPATPLKLESIDVVKLRRTLMQVESDRNDVMQMVEERNEEIVRLKCMLEQKPRAASNSESEMINKLQHEAKCLRMSVDLQRAQATIDELKMKIEASKNANAHAELDRLVQEECNKHNALRVKLDECKSKLEQLEIQNQGTDELISKLLVQKQKTESSS